MFTSIGVRPIACAFALWSSSQYLLYSACMRSTNSAQRVGEVRMDKIAVGAEEAHGRPAVVGIATVGFFRHPVGMQAGGFGIPHIRIIGDDANVVAVSVVDHLAEEILIA